MTQTRWFLAGVLVLGLCGPARPQQNTQSTTPASTRANGIRFEFCVDGVRSTNSAPSCSSPTCCLGRVLLQMSGIGVLPEPMSAIRSGAAACIARIISDKQNCCACCEGTATQPKSQSVGCSACTAGVCGACSAACPQTHSTAGLPVGDCGTTCAATQEDRGRRVIILRTFQANDATTRTIVFPTAPVASTTLSRVSSVPVQAVPCPPPQSPGEISISVKGKQIQIVTPTMQATCDRVTSLSRSPGQLILHGNVKLNSPELKLEARNIVIDVNSNEFMVPTVAGTIRPAQHIGLWYAPSPMPMLFPPAPAMPPMHSGFFTTPVPHPMPVSKPINRGFVPAAHYQPLMPTLPPK
jgi:hypothetical protein